MTTQRFSAKDIRQYTFKVGLSRTEGGLMELVSEVYTYILGALTLLTFAGAVILGLRNSLGVGHISVVAASAVAPGFHSATLLQASATVLLTAAAALLMVEMSVGPIAMSIPQTSWWLSLPVKRRGFIQPGFFKSLIWPTLGAVLLVVPLALGSVANPTPGSIALATVCGIGLAWLIYGLAAWCQVNNKRKGLGAVASAITLIAPLTVVATALYNNMAGTASIGAHQVAWLAYLPSSWPLLVADGTLWPLVLILFALAILILVFVTMERITTQRLKDSAAAGAYVAGSLLSMDATELSKSLTGPTQYSRSRIRLPLVFRGGTAFSRSVKTLLSTHAVMALRSPKVLLRVLVLATIPASFAAVEFLGNAILIAVVTFLCAYLATTSLGATARFANGNPAVDLLMALPAKVVRRIHYVIPALSMTLWMAVSFALLLALGVGSPSLLILAILAGPGLGGATTRAGFRAAPDWNMPAVATASGPMPLGAVRAFLVGPDLALITLLPVLICLISGGVPLLAFPLQIALSLLAYLWGTRLRKPNSEGGIFGLPVTPPPAPAAK